MQIQIPDGLGAWLEEIAARVGESPEEFANKALYQALEDREDYMDALEGARSAELEGTISLEEVMRELDLEDCAEQGSATATEKAGQDNSATDRQLSQ